LSSTKSRRWSRKKSFTVSISACSPASRTPSASAIAAGTRSGSPSEARETTQTPSWKLPPPVPARVAAYATVNANGTLVASQPKNIISSFALGGFGAYQINTSLPSLAGCTYSVTSAFPGNSGTPPPMFSGVTGRAATVNDVFVQTYNIAGNDRQESFMLQIYC
jgi:hypothetical protein